MIFGAAGNLFRLTGFESYQAGRPAALRLEETIMRNFTAFATIFAASAVLFGFNPAAPAQTWVETHPVLTDAGNRVQSPDMRAETKPTPFREAQLRSDDGRKPDDRAKIDKGSLDHPANASGESSRHK
jgi:hypothetical protein